MRYLFLVLAILILAMPLAAPIAHAQATAQPTTAAGTGGFTALAPIPNLTQNADTGNLALFFNNLYKFCIGIAAVLAILQIIHGGFLYMTSEAVGSKSEGKNLIVMSLLGLLLVLLPYAVFSVINPTILDLSKFNSDVGGLTPSAASNTGTPAANTGAQMTQAVCGSYSQFKELPSGSACSSLGGGWISINQQACCVGNVSPVAGSACCALDPNYTAPTPPQSFYSDKSKIPSGAWCYQVKDGFSCAGSQSACQSARNSETDPSYVLSYCSQY